jgi:uncharacterized protein YkwD
MKFLSIIRLAAVTALALALAACSMMGGGQQLSSGLSARMDAPGASLSRVEALFLLNDYRRSQGAMDLRGDAVLDSTAQSLATAYAKSGTPPAAPKGIRAIRFSAGYATFAETFSGWRNVPSDAAVLADMGAKRAGLGVAYEANSTNGVHWVLLLAE